MNQDVASSPVVCVAKWYSARISSPRSGLTTLDDHLNSPAPDWAVQYCLAFLHSLELNNESSILAVPSSSLSQTLIDSRGGWAVHL